MKQHKRVKRLEQRIANCEEKIAPKVGAQQPGAWHRPGSNKR